MGSRVIPSCRVSLDRGPYGPPWPILALLVLLTTACSVTEPVSARRTAESRRLTTPVPGAEDLALDSRAPYLYLSCLDRRNPGERGAVYVLDLLQPDQPVDLTMTLDGPFHPHGIGWWADPGASVGWLFVINHRGPEDEAIEVFRSDRPGQLVHHLTLDDPSLALNSPNDIAPVSSTSFYVTNLFGSSSSTGRLLEQFGLIDRGYVGFCADIYEPGCERVLEDLGMPNGIHAGADTDRLYVSTSGTCELIVCRRGTAGSLEPLDVHHLPGLGDNISEDEAGDLWIGLSQDRWDFGLNLVFGGESGSRIVRVPLDDRGDVRTRAGEPIVRDILVDDGARLSASSSAVRWRDQLFVGTVFDHAVRYRLTRPEDAP